MTVGPGATRMRHNQSSWLFAPLLIGAAVSVALGVYGNVHEPTGIAVNISGFSSQQTVKVWLATGAIVFAVVQLLNKVGDGVPAGHRAPLW